MRADIALKDLLYFQPTLDSIGFFKQNASKAIGLRTTAEGTLKDLKIPDLEVSLWDKTRMQLAGRIFDLLDLNKTNAFLKINILETTATAMHTFLPKAAFPNTSLCLNTYPQRAT